MFNLSIAANTAEELRLKLLDLVDHTYIETPLKSIL